MSDQQSVGYQELYDNFRWQVPDYFNFGFDVIDRWAADENHRAMIWVDDDGTTQELSYGYFREQSNRVANLLRELALQPGDRVMILLSRIPAWWECMLGMIKGGQIALPATTQLTSKDISYRLQAANARAVITDSENAAKFDEVRAENPAVTNYLLIGDQREGWHNYNQLMTQTSSEITEANRFKSHKDDPMLLYFTSGTTGYPKMVLHTHSSYPIGHQITGSYWLDLKPHDLHWNLSDTGWAKAAWSNLFGPFSAGAALFIHNGKGKFSAQTTLEMLARYPITSFCAPPTAYRMLIVEDLTKHNLSRLRSTVAAGEPLNPEVIEQWQTQTGMTIREGYGQTETVAIIANFPGMKVKPGSMGKPSPGFIVDTIDEQGQPTPPNVEGDIGVRINPVRPVGLFQEYWNDDEANRNARRGDWYITGDRAFRDEEGYFWFIGRADDVIISAGYRIGPFEVESSLIEHSAVLEAAVIGKPDINRGQIVKAFVILKPGYQGTTALAQELQEFVKNITAPYKYPREIEFVSELPKTISGKIRRVELRQR